MESICCQGDSATFCLRRLHLQKMRQWDVPAHAQKWICRSPAQHPGAGVAAVSAERIFGNSKKDLLGGASFETCPLRDPCLISAFRQGTQSSLQHAVKSCSWLHGCTWIVDQGRRRLAMHIPVNRQNHRRPSFLNFGGSNFIHLVSSTRWVVFGKLCAEGGWNQK